MSRLTLALRLTTHLAAASALLLAIGGPARAAIIMINNGLAPPNPANVFDDSAYSSDTVYVRNVACPPGWPAANPNDPCPAAGAATEAALMNAGFVGALFAYDSSTITMSGGDVVQLAAYGSSTITISDGDVDQLAAYGSSTITMSGGDVVPPSPMYIGLVVYDSSTVTISGGRIYWGLRVYDSSTVTIDGGLVYNGLAAHDSSAVTITEGQVEGLLADGSSTAIISGGQINGNLLADASSTVTISEGLVTGALSTSGFSTTTMSGGIVDHNLEAYDSSTVTVNGGRLGFMYPLLVASDSSTITLVGGDFEVDGTPVPYGDLTAQTGALTGTLASGDPINHLFYQGGGSYTGTITLVAPPDPVPSVSFGGLAVLAGLVLGSVAWARRDS